MSEKRQQEELIEQFKKFVNEHPAIVQDIRSEKYTLQQFFEEWYLLGGEDPRWNEYKLNDHTKKDKNKLSTSSTSSSDWTEPLINFFKKIDPKQVDEQINNLSRAIDALQGIVTQFQKEDSQHIPNNNQQHHPFQFRKD